VISTRVLIGITLVIFFVGLSTGFVIFQTSNQSATTIQSHDPTVESNLARFDKLDFEAFSKQNWELFNQIHSSDVLVVFPNGRETRGIDQHTKDISAMFAYAPDTRVTSHPIKFGSGQWTVSTGILEGTFTQPIPFPDGGTISPTGKSFKVTMTTIAKWNDGRISEEHLFWDNTEIMKQMGLNP
jgi:ketosteroid isomerase-like protein